jgi:hypothetical protein
MKHIKDVKGLDWDIGAIGNATWTGTSNCPGTDQSFCAVDNVAAKTLSFLGVRLRDVLAHAGLAEDGGGTIDQDNIDHCASHNTTTLSQDLEHVHFEGLDRDMVQSYGVSIPMAKAIDPRVPLQPRSRLLCTAS